jgi:hypothetical protein
MPWQKITLTQDQIIDRAGIDIFFRFAEARSRAGHPEGFALFESKEHSGVTSGVFFLPPSTVNYLADVLADYNATSCEIPASDSVEMTIGDERDFAFWFAR